MKAIGATIGATWTSTSQGPPLQQCKKQRRGGVDEGNVYLARGPDCILRQITDRFDIALSDGAASRAGWTARQQPH
jgi:hypothetical protein